MKSVPRRSAPAIWVVGIYHLCMHAWRFVFFQDGLPEHTFERMDFLWRAAHHLRLSSPAASRMYSLSSTCLAKSLKRSRISHLIPVVVVHCRVFHAQFFRIELYLSLSAVFNSSWTYIYILFPQRFCRITAQPFRVFRYFLRFWCDGSHVVLIFVFIVPGL